MIELVKTSLGGGSCQIPQMKTEGAAFLRSMYLSHDIPFFSLMQEPDRPQQHQQEAWMIPPVFYQVPDVGFSA